MAYQLIQTVTLASAASSIEFTSIPQDGVDLELKVSARGLQGVSFARLNSDSTAGNYPNRLLGGSGSAVSTFVLDNIRVNQSAFGDTVNTFGNTSVYISNYSLSTQSKSVSVDGVTENNAAAATQSLLAVSYTPTAAITSIQVGFTGGLDAGSVFSLYKIS